MTYSSEANAQRPGRVAVLRGIILQNDGKSKIGRYFIRPFEALDRRIAGVLPSPAAPPLAMHGGLHVVLENGRDFVAEQLVGTPYMDFRSGLNWTPLDQFQERDRGGWDVTIPATALRGVDEQVVAETVQRLNTITGRPFVGEDCTAFIERAFGGRRLFADSPLLQALGVGVRVGDPALPLLKADSTLDARSEELLHADALRRLPDATADASSPNARLWFRRLVPTIVGGAAGGFLLARALRARGAS